MSVTVYATIPCDEADDFDGIVTNGWGAAWFDDEHNAAGDAAFVVTFVGEDHWAYGHKMLGTSIGNEDYFRIGFWMRYDESGDFPASAPGVVKSSTSTIRLFDTVNTKILSLFIDGVEDPDPPPEEYPFRFVTNAGATAAAGTFEPGWKYGTYHYIELFGYVHATEGWVEIWEGGKCHLSLHDICTYTGSAWNQIRVGSNFNNDENFFAYVFDDIVVDDGQPPDAAVPHYVVMQSRRLR